MKSKYSYPFVVLFHGPDVFDTQNAHRFIENYPEAVFFQAGTMGKTAAFDNYLDDVISIPDFPGKVIRESIECEFLLLCLYPKSIYSGKAFVRLILDHAKVSIPVVHADCKSKKFVIWQGDFPDEYISRLVSMGFSQDEPIDSIAHLTYSDNAITRHLQACEKDDYVLCNNILIGTAEGEDVSITVKDGAIIGTSGIAVKFHGIEKIDAMGHLDITSAKCCATPLLRGNVSNPRVMAKQGSGVAFVNHAGAFVHELTSHCEGAVVVGDDTSRIVGDALYRHAKPVYAITDGDWDGLIGEELFYPGSYLIEVDMDDAAGENVYCDIFFGNTHLDMPFEQVCDKITMLLDDKIRKIKSY